MQCNVMYVMYVMYGMYGMYGMVWYACMCEIV